jgi:hypothetical protein
MRTQHRAGRLQHDRQVEPTAPKVTSGESATNSIANVR